MNLPANSASTLPIVIVGAGHAGGTAAALLSQHGCLGPIIMIGEEAELPYQRPPLSKDWLIGEVEAEHLFLRKKAFYRKANIDFRPNTRVVSVEPARKAIVLDTGEHLRYERLILATGSLPRTLALPGSDAANILMLRDMQHANTLKRTLKDCKHLVVIGGGYIGLEVAASALGLGVQITVVEAEARLLARVASPELSAFFETAHRKAGANIELEALVCGFTVNDGRVSGVTLRDGRTIGCDAVLVGVGAIAADELARNAGLSCDNGIVVDGEARTEDESIYAIGDCSRHPLDIYGGMHRLESVPNALLQAKQAAASICGRPQPPMEVPWFWSSQYELKLQIAGMPINVAHRVVRSYLDKDSIVVFHLDQDHRLQAVEAVNAPVDFATGRKLIATRSPLDLAALSDETVLLADAQQAM